MDFRNISDSELLKQMSALVQSERKLTAEIIEFIKEIDRRKLYISLGFTSLFDYMTRHLGYTPGSAQRRIDSARLLRDVPELKAQIQTGELNLSQLSAVARAVREKQKTASVSLEDKRELIHAIQSQDLLTSEQTIAQMLDLPVKEKEIKLFQQDESVRIELTLSKQQYALLEEVKALMSHVNPNPTVSDLFEYLAKRWIKQKTGAVGSVTENKNQKTVTAKMAVEKNRAAASNKRYIPSAIRKQILQRSTGCQWKTEGKQCGSRFQPQIDHIQPIWAGGESTPENLQLLCAHHNRMKYRIESNRIWRAHMKLRPRVHGSLESRQVPLLPRVLFRPKLKRMRHGRDSAVEALSREHLVNRIPRLVIILMPVIVNTQPV